MGLIQINLNFLKTPNLYNIKIRICMKLKEITQQFLGIFTCSIMTKKHVTMGRTRIRVILENKRVDLMRDLSISHYFIKDKLIQIVKIIGVSPFNLSLTLIHLTVGTKFENTSKEKLQRKRNLLWPTSHPEHHKIIS